MIFVQKTQTVPKHNCNYVAKQFDVILIKKGGLWTVNYLGVGL